FFSSRRRHTRWPRDWSSDVCSSDLDDGFQVSSDAVSTIRWNSVKFPVLVAKGPDYLSLSTIAKNHGTGLFMGSSEETTSSPCDQIGRASCRERVYSMVARGAEKQKE